MKNETQKPDYLNPRFKVGLYDWDKFVGPGAGEPAVDFTCVDFNDKQHSLSDYRGKWVVIETGSATCSQYSKNINNMKAMQAEFPDVAFVLVYVREAHPGERLKQHRTFADKLEAAKLLPTRYEEHRLILVDTLDGGMHRAYGSMPNVVYVVNPEGIIHYRCDWTYIDGLRKALTERDHPHTEEHAVLRQISAQRSIWTAVRTMWTGGIIALWDFVAQTPALYKKHKLIDAYYNEHGRFKRTAD